MINYDFLLLSPHEFECIARDLLQKHLSWTFIESFTTGRDGGIDLRYCTDKEGLIVVQAKRFKDYSSLFSHLKKEATKVKILSPSRYIFVTSVGLTPANKKSIKKLFNTFIANDSDIYGKDDLNNLLSLYPDVERKYYKLWLSSTNILSKILHSKIYNQSAFELEEIQESLKLYVQNDSFNLALDILNKHRYLIISGIPGIGKTTLARILIHYLLSGEFDEFVYLNQSIDEGYEYFADGKRQVFLFDDFLGRNFLEEKHSANEDNKIVKFIQKVKRSNDKALILTTREYILNQASDAFEAFRINNIEIAKCVLDLSSYNNVIKAHILYNHLFFADIPTSHLNNLVESDGYKVLVKHTNYNPRIIETIIKRRVWENCEPKDFPDLMKSFFDKPDSVWLHAFENSIDRTSRFTLLVLLGTGTPILFEDLRSAVHEYVRINRDQYDLLFDSRKFEKIVRELENTFIKTEVDSRDSITVEYQNPSIRDFLLNYLKGKDDIIKSLVSSAIFVDQFFNAFTSKPTNELRRQTINVGVEVRKVMVDRIIEKYERLKRCRLIATTWDHGRSYFWDRQTKSEYEFLERIVDESFLGCKKLELFVYSTFQKLVLVQENSYFPLQAYIDILETLELKSLVFKEDEMLFAFLGNMYWIDEFSLFERFSKIFPSSYKKVTRTTKFAEELENILSDEIGNFQGSLDDYESLKSTVLDLQQSFKLDLQRFINRLESMDMESESEYGASSDSDSVFWKKQEVSYRSFEEDKIIKEIFNSLSPET